MSLKSKAKSLKNLEHKLQKESAPARLIGSHSDAFAHSVKKVFGDAKKLENGPAESVEIDPKKIVESKDKLPTKG